MPQQSGQGTSPVNVAGRDRPLGKRLHPAHARPGAARNLSAAVTASRVEPRERAGGSVSRHFAASADLPQAS